MSAEFVGSPSLGFLNSVLLCGDTSLPGLQLPLCLFHTSILTLFPFFETKFTVSTSLFSFKLEIQFWAGFYEQWPPCYLIQGVFLSAGLLWPLWSSELLYCFLILESLLSYQRSHHTLQLPSLPSKLFLIFCRIRLDLVFDVGGHQQIVQDSFLPTHFYFEKFQTYSQEESIVLWTQNTLT